MTAADQKKHILQLCQALAQRTDVGPYEPPEAGQRRLCNGNRTWLLDTSTLQLARQLAHQADHRYRCRVQILGLHFGQPTKDPLYDHYGFTAEDMERIKEIDFSPIPDQAHHGRDTWRSRQTENLQGIAKRLEPEPVHATNRDELFTVEAMPKAPPEQTHITNRDEVFKAEAPASPRPESELAHRSATTVT